VTEKKKMTTKTKLILIGVGVVFFGVIAFAGIELTCTSWFCLSCHEMQELGASWKISKHGPDNPEMNNCMKCHAKPGFLGFIKAKVSGLFSLVYHLSGNYHLEATQPVVCLRNGCHQLEDLDRASRDQTITLNHAKHLKVMNEIGTRTNCIPCHRDIAHGEETFLPDMKKICFVCHTDRSIGSENCSLCHPTHPKVNLQDYEETILDLHQEAEISCVECHTDACKASKATCDECHEGDDYGELIIYKGKKLK